MTCCRLCGVTIIKGIVYRVKGDVICNECRELVISADIEEVNNLDEWKAMKAAEFNRRNYNVSNGGDK